MRDRTARLIRTVKAEIRQGWLDWRDLRASQVRNLIVLRTVQFPFNSTRRLPSLFQTLNVLPRPISRPVFACPDSSPTLWIINSTPRANRTRRRPGPSPREFQRCKERERNIPTMLRATVLFRRCPLENALRGKVMGPFSFTDTFLSCRIWKRERVKESQKHFAR